jgi:leucyl aminopeptidase
MLEIFARDEGNAIPISAVSEATLPGWLEAHPKSRQWIAAIGFKGEPGTFAFIPDSGGRPSGVLASPADGASVWAYSGLSMALPEGTYALEIEDRDAKLTDMALGWALGSYAFTRYKKPQRSPATLVWPTKDDRAEVERIANGVFLARDLINTPCEDMGPEHLADAALAVARTHGAAAHVITGEELLLQNYPTIHIVGRASSRAPRLIDLRWGDESAPKVTLVGKGVCFDTGGLDLKSREGMLEMKKDMGGAAVVLGLASALMSANTPIRLRVLIPAVENSVAGNAYRPLDIVRTRSGKTVEIGNTDAEGRLILCDALAEADSERPDLLVDCATLTGAARSPLGPSSRRCSAMTTQLPRDCRMPVSAWETRYGGCPSGGRIASRSMANAPISTMSRKARLRDQSSGLSISPNSYRHRPPGHTWTSWPPIQPRNPDAPRAAKQRACARSMPTSGSDMGDCVSAAAS